MKNEEAQFLNLRSKPHIVGMEEASWILGFPTHVIPLLVRAHLLTPLGSPERNAKKYFLTQDLINKASDEKWCARAVNVVYKHWQRKETPSVAAP